MELNVVVGSDGSSSLEGDDFLYTKATYLIQPTTPPTTPTTLPPLPPLSGERRPSIAAERSSTVGGIASHAVSGQHIAVMGRSERLVTTRPSPAGSDIGLLSHPALEGKDDRLSATAAKIC